MNERPNVVCIGEALWDALPAGRVPGGAPMNVALRLAAFGTRARLLTRVGEDEAGSDLLAFMRSEGLDTRWVQVDPAQPTGHVTVDTADPQAPQFRIAAPVAWDFIDAEEFLAAAGGPVDVLVYGSLAARHPVSRDSQRKLVGVAGLKVFDLNLRPPHDDPVLVEEFLRCADWVKLNAAELQSLAWRHGGPGDVREAAAWLAARYGVGTVCVTLGRDGALLLHDGAWHAAPGYCVQVADTVGCGDAFLGALVAGLLDSDEPGTVLQRACAAGAIVARSAGGNARVTAEAVAELAKSAGTGGTTSAGGGAR